MGMVRWLDSENSRLRRDTRPWLLHACYDQSFLTRVYLAIGPLSDDPFHSSLHRVIKRITVRSAREQVEPGPGGNGRALRGPLSLWNSALPDPLRWDRLDVRRMGQRSAQALASFGSYNLLTRGPRESSAPDLKPPRTPVAPTPRIATSRRSPAAPTGAIDGSRSVSPRQPRVAGTAPAGGAGRPRPPGHPGAPGCGISLAASSILPGSCRTRQTDAGTRSTHGGG